MKEQIKQIIVDFVYQLYRMRILKNDIKVMSIDATLDKLLTTDISIIRFGDAELEIIEGNSTSFQKADKDLAEQLRSLLTKKTDKILVSIPDIFDSLDMYTEKSQRFWKEHLLFFRKKYKKYCNDGYVYGNALVSRCYYMVQNKQQCGLWFEKTKELWENRKVVLVEGDISRNGVDNDLFDNVKSLERIICPGNNAYSVYEKVKEVCFTYPKDTLFLLSVGNMAKVLVRDLVEKDYRALDIGNLDMEYYWYLEGVDYKKHPPKRDYTLSDKNKTAGFEKYLTEIKHVIKE